MIIILGLVIAMGICIKGMKTDNVLYKGGFYFFQLMLFQKIYFKIIPMLIDTFLKKGLTATDSLFMILHLPSIILEVLALAIFIIFLSKGLNENVDN